MTFNSLQFAVFFAVVWTAYWALPRRRLQNVLLLAASYAFYAWWDWRFMFLLAGSTVVDYFAVRRMEAVGDDEHRRRRWMVFSVAVNLTVLAFFKYFNFFSDSALSGLRRLGLDVSDPVLRFALPIGISFYVFHEISYAVDVYRRRTHAERDFVVYAVFVAFFPQLVAGPITRAAHMLPQFRRERHFPDSERLYSGAVLIMSGLFKKVVLADGVAPYVNTAFAHPQGRGAIPLAFAAVGFSIQIYGDFAGYTDIARGVARLFGIELARNFEQPYLSRNITEFWRTWHISLSSWLHDYLYVPLGGNRRTPLVTYRNLMITMLLGGLWHGASWHFVVWGGLNGLALAIHRARSGRTARGRPESPTADDVPSIVGTFALVTMFWVFFRSASLSDAWTFFSAMGHSIIGRQAGAWKPAAITIMLFAAATVAIDAVDRRRLALRPLHEWPGWLQGALAGATVVALIVWSGAAPQPFIYFRF